MSTEVKVPVLPDAVSDAVIASWHKQVGQAVKRDENLVDLETDKVVLEVPSPVDGVLKSISANTGDTVTSQQVIAVIEAGAAAEAPSKAESPKAEAAKPAAAAPASSGKGNEDLSPAGRRVAEQHGIDASKVDGTGRGGRVTKEDLVKQLNAGDKAPAASAVPAVSGDRSEHRVPMTRMRAKIAERLMQSKNSIAMLTSFNEINLGPVMKMRKTMQEQFEKTHGVKLGFMSFFAKAAANALQRHPVINASVDGNDVLYHNYADISIAVSTDKGLVTPVLRNVESMSFADIEKAIGEYARMAREGGLKLEDLQGGTFTITNGGTFGSLFSTPIVNPPQSAILGMHAIKERAIAEDGQVDIKNQLDTPHRMLRGL